MKEIGLYVHIPFCKQKCNYCSFISQSVKGSQKLIPQYIDLLCEELKYTSKIVKKNQVAYNPARANIGSIAMLKDHNAGLVSPIYVVFEMKETITPTYFYYYMKQPMFLEGIKHHAIGTTRQNFPFEAFKMFPMVVPPMDLQLEFEKIAKPIEEKIAKLKEENEVLAEIRDTLLPKLMNGEISLEEGEK